MIYIIKHLLKIFFSLVYLFCLFLKYQMSVVFGIYLYVFYFIQLDYMFSFVCVYVNIKLFYYYTSLMHLEVWNDNPSSITRHEQNPLEELIIVVQLALKTIYIMTVIAILRIWKNASMTEDCNLSTQDLNHFNCI